MIWSAQGVRKMFYGSESAFERRAAKEMRKETRTTGIMAESESEIAAGSPVKLNTLFTVSYTTVS
jgi:hypothetical protein